MQSKIFQTENDIFNKISIFAGSKILLFCQMDEKNKSLIINLINKKLKRLETYLSALNILSDYDELNQKKENNPSGKNNSKTPGNELTNLMDEISKLKLALESISNEDFGICSICNASIPVQRLILNPQAYSCSKCERI
jgi:RNA polymerase-binding transcription factor DksA